MVCQTYPRRPLPAKLRLQLELRIAAHRVKSTLTRPEPESIALKDRVMQRSRDAVNDKLASDKWRFEATSSHEYVQSMWN